MTRIVAQCALTLGLLALPALATAHEVVFEVERSRAVALRAWHSDGEALANAGFEVFAPDGKIHLTGRTDAQGYLAFVPSAPGSWRIRVADELSHGLDTRIEIPASGAAAPALPSSSRGPRGLYRPLVGAALIGLIFGGLFFLYRRKPKAPSPR